MYVNLVNCLKTSNLIILSLPLQPVRELNQLIEYLIILSHSLQDVREHGQLIEYL